LEKVCDHSGLCCWKLREAEEVVPSPLVAVASLVDWAVVSLMLSSTAEAAVEVECPLLIS
jgi:hypothetical protein